MPMKALPILSVHWLVTDYTQTNVYYKTQIIWTRDKFTKGNKSGVLLYKINYENCPATYVGEILIHLTARLHEYQRAIRCHNTHSQIGIYCIEHDHYFNFAKIIANWIGFHVSLYPTTTSSDKLTSPTSLYIKQRK